MKKSGSTWEIIDRKLVKPDPHIFNKDEKPYMKDVFGYTPPIHKEEVEVTRETMLEQIVYSIDLWRVIQAINEPRMADAARGSQGLGFLPR